MGDMVSHMSPHIFESMHEPNDGSPGYLPPGYPANPCIAIVHNLVTHNCVTQGCINAPCVRVKPQTDEAMEKGANFLACTS